MKVNDNLPLYVGNVQVGTATVVDVQHDRITVETPALRSVIAVRMQLTDEKDPDLRGDEQIVTGVDRPGNSDQQVTSEEIPAAQDAAPAAPVTPPAPAPVPEGAAAEVQDTPAASVEPAAAEASGSE